MRARRIVASSFGIFFLVVLAACQQIRFNGASGAGAPPAVVAPAPATTPNLNAAAVSAAESAAVAGGREMVWGAVSNCTCHEYLGTSSVAAAVDNAQIGASVEELSETASDVFFYVTFDPKVTTRDRVVAAIKKGGGRIKAGPPTSINE